MDEPGSREHILFYLINSGFFLVGFGVLIFLYSSHHISILNDAPEELLNIILFIPSEKTAAQGYLELASMTGIGLMALGLFFAVAGGLDYFVSNPERYQKWYHGNKTMLFLSVGLFGLTALIYLSVFEPASSMLKLESGFEGFESADFRNYELAVIGHAVSGGVIALLGLLGVFSLLHLFVNPQIRDKQSDEQQEEKKGDVLGLDED